MLPVLSSGRIVLRPLLLEDADAAHRFLSDEEVMRYWSSGPHVDLDETEQYIMGNCDGGSHESWAITQDDDSAIGWVNFTAHRPGVYEIGYILARDAWGQGLAYQALRLAIAHIFDTLDARRIFADTDPENVASIGLLERLGFTCEGRLRAEWQTHIGIRDSLIFGMLSDEWRG